MTASIISLPGCRAERVRPVDGDESPFDQFNIYVGCLMSTGYALSGSLLAPFPKSASQYVAKFIDDPALLAKIVVHPEHQKLWKFLLGYVLLEHARSHLWDEVEELMRRR